IAFSDNTSKRSANRGWLLISRRSLSCSACASVSEKVVKSTRLSGWLRARNTARCSATMVFPVPAERPIQLLHIVHPPEAALRMGVIERTGARDGGHGKCGPPAGRQFKQRFCGLGRKMIRQRQQFILIGD